MRTVFYDVPRVHKAWIDANEAVVPHLSYFSVDKQNNGGFCLHTTSQLAGGAVPSLLPPSRIDVSTVRSLSFVAVKDMIE
ncbi:hypothetical protein PTKU15_13740 [Paraburkholderia terrae]|nr:hypothetical protein PTKU15_13740 [Paraburkholderia terrae]